MALCNIDLLLQCEACHVNAVGVIIEVAMYLLEQTLLCFITLLAVYRDNLLYSEYNNEQWLFNFFLSSIISFVLLDTKSRFAFQSFVL